MKHVHHWNVAGPESAIDGRVDGYCRECGAERAFDAIGPSGNAYLRAYGVPLTTYARTVTTKFGTGVQR